MVATFVGEDVHIVCNRSEAEAMRNACHIAYDPGNCLTAREVVARGDVQGIDEFSRVAAGLDELLHPEFND